VDPSTSPSDNVGQQMKKENPKEVNPKTSAGSNLFSAGSNNPKRSGTSTFGGFRLGEGANQEDNMELF